MRLDFAFEPEGDLLGREAEVQQRRLPRPEPLAVRAGAGKLDRLAGGAGEFELAFAPPLELLSAGRPAQVLGGAEKRVA